MLLVQLQGPLTLLVRSALLSYTQDASTIFPNSSLDGSSRSFNRKPLTNVAILEDRRQTSVKIQPSTFAFRTTFTRLTGHLLMGLDWTHIFVAGGIVLTTLGLTDYEADAAIHVQSDIDLYIYGIEPAEAIKILGHIETVYKSNLPPGAPFNILKNSRTVTYVPTRPSCCFRPY